MLKFFSLLCAIVSSVTILPPVYAESADSKEEAIKELLLVMHARENMEASLTAMKDTIKMNSAHFYKEIMAILLEELDADTLDKAAQKYIQDDFGAERLYQLFRYNFNIERLEKEVMIPIYSDHYNEDEIQRLITFYRSDLGRKTLRLMPEISRSISSRTREMSQMAISQAEKELALELKKSLQ